jgi:uncharacterized protein YyaL (SSP411 family)
LEGLLGQEEGQTFGRFYDVTTAGNFEGGKSILHKWIDPGSFSKDRKVPLPKLEDILSRGRRRLLEARSQRVRPHRDDKILTSWNGLMISSFAYAHQVLEEPKYLAAAQNAADFILRNLLTDAGLLRRYRDKEAGISAYLDDYAFLVHGLIELYQATFEPRWIREAISLNRQMIEAYHDPEGKGFFFTRKGDETLLMRTKDFYDSALPSGNAMAILNLFRLSEFTSDQSLKELGLETLEQLSGSLSQAPSAFAQSLIALDFMLSSPMEIAVIGAKEDPGTRSMIWAVRKPFSPGKIVAWSPGGDKNAVKEIPFLEGKIAIEGRPTAYICRNYTCKKPLTDPAEVKKVLTGKEKGG